MAKNMTKREEELIKRGKMIVESFGKTFDKIQRIKEKTVFQELDELSTNNLYDLEDEDDDIENEVI